MSRRQIGLFRQVLLVFDVLVTLVAFGLSFELRQWLANAAPVWREPPRWLVGLGMPVVADARAYESLLWLVIPVWSLALYSAGTGDFRLSYRQITGRYARGVALGIAMLVTLAFILKLHFVARSFVVLFAGLDLALLVLGRCAVLETIAFMRSRRVDGHRVVVVGCSDRAVALAQILAAQALWNIKLLGFVSVPGERVSEGAVPQLASVDALDQLLDHTPIDEVLFATDAATLDALSGGLNACDDRGVEVLLPLPAALPARSRVEIANLEGSDAPLLGLRRTPTGELRIAFKRTLDIIGGLIALVIAAPVMIIVAMAIRLESKGPVLFKQVRCGRNGRHFTMLKFRSMVADAEAKKADLMHLNEMSGPVFKIRRDPRITRVGGLIRKTSIDELPQLFNIIFGDMSLVGPRPPLPAEVEKYKPWQRRRLSVKPGLTGLWQVSGRSNVDFEEWMKLDLRYIDDWSLWLDVKILLRTVPAVFFKDGAS
ncbi:MAG: sugar transferase [Deltaproteobacteria bacterium]|nr:sugar transferase [Deltaproteobacteria bacterium]